MRVSSFRLRSCWKKSNLSFWGRKGWNKQIYWKYQVWFSRRVSIPTRQWKRKFVDWALLYTWELFDLDQTRKNEACGFPDIWVWLQRWSRNTLPPLKRNPSKLKNFRGRSCRKTLSAWLQRTLLLKLCKLRRKMEIFVGLSTRFPISGAKVRECYFFNHPQSIKSFSQIKPRTRNLKL